MHRDYLQNNLSEPTPGFKKKKLLFQQIRHFVMRLRLRHMCVRCTYFLKLDKLT